MVFLLSDCEQFVLTRGHSNMRKCASVSAAMSVSSVGQSDSVDHTWRSCNWQHTKVEAIRGNVPEFREWGPRYQVQGHTRGLKMVLLNSLGRVSY